MTKWWKDAVAIAMNGILTIQCPQFQSPNYRAQAIDQEAPGRVSDHGSSSSYTSSDKSTTTTHSFHNIPAPQSADIFPHDIQHVKYVEIRLRGADKLAVEEIVVTPHIDTGISYLTTEPCPIKAWVGETPSSDVLLKLAVADSKSLASLIDRN